MQSFGTSWNSGRGVAAESIHGEPRASLGAEKRRKGAGFSSPSSSVHGRGLQLPAVEAPASHHRTWTISGARLPPPSRMESVKIRETSPCGRTRLEAGDEGRPMKAGLGRIASATIPNSVESFNAHLHARRAEFKA